MALTEQQIRQITDEIVRNLAGSLKLSETSAPKTADGCTGRWLCDTAEEAIQNAKAAQLKLAEMTLEKLRQFKMLEGIRTKESVNKDAMADWTDERLATVGLCRRKTDSFFWEAKEEDLPSV